MALLTILMAVLTSAGIVSGAILMVLEDWRPVLGGATVAGAALAALALATLMGAGLDTLAGRLRTRRPLAASVLAMIGSLVPVGAMMIGSYAVVRQLGDPVGAHPVPMLLWTYAVASGPATVVAKAAKAGQRTLWGLRAYAGHVACMILLAGAWLSAPAMSLATLLVVVWSIIPIVMGCVMTLADPIAIRDVRV